MGSEILNHFLIIWKQGSILNNRIFWNSCTVLTTYFVINFINYTYSKNVELWPMTLAPTYEDFQVITRRKTFLGKKKPCVGYLH